MKKSDIALTKICRSCGQQKPLSAFLQLGAPRNTTYGNICADCRKTAPKINTPKESDEASTSTTGHRIDSKAKVHAEIDKRQQRKDKEESDHQLYIKGETTRSEKSEKLTDTARSEKKHRDRNFFVKPIEKTTSAEPVIGGTEHTAEESEFDFKNPFIDTQFAGKEKQKVLRQRFNWLGNAPAASSIKESAPQKDPLVEFIKKEWGSHRKK